MLTKCFTAFACVAALFATSLFAEELPKEQDSFEVEPPLLIPALESETARSGFDSAEASVSVETLQKRLERSKESAASAERLVKAGVLAKVEAEQRALRVLRVEADLANAQLAIGQEQVAAQKKRMEGGQTGADELAAATRSLAQAEAAAQLATANYEKAQLEAAERNLRRQKQLFAKGSARKSDVATAEEKLTNLRQDGNASAEPTPSQ